MLQIIYLIIYQKKNSRDNSIKAKTFSDRSKIFEYTESCSKKDKLIEYNILDINNNINNIYKENK